MEKAKHCLICEHRKTEYNTGSYCGLTLEKPDFQYKCSRITFGKRLRQQITEKQLLHYQASMKKTHAVSNLVSYSILALVSTGLGIWLLNVLWLRGLLDTLPFLLIGFAVTLFVKGIRIFADYKQGMRAENERLADLHAVTDLYGIQYETEVTGKNFISGEPEFLAGITFTRVPAGFYKQ